VLNSISQAATLLDLKQEALQASAAYCWMIPQRCEPRRRDHPAHSRKCDGPRGHAGDRRGILRKRWSWRDRCGHGFADFRLSAGIPAKAPITGQCRDVRRAFVNLIINAIQVMPKGESCRSRPPSKDHGASFALKIPVPGSQRSTSQDLFPYFTTKQGGNGLGLAARNASSAPKVDASSLSRKGSGGRSFV